MVDEVKPESSVFFEMVKALDPVESVRSRGVEPFEWQKRALDPTVKRVIMLCHRQAGKSTVVAGAVDHAASTIPRSLSLIVSPTEKQSRETMLKVKDYMKAGGIPELGGQFEQTYPNGARVVALPGSEQSVRGYSGPNVIVVDEAARCPEGTYMAIRPTQLGKKNAKQFLVSTAFGKNNFFYRTWTHGTGWRKILVVPPWKLEGGELVERESLEEWRKTLPKGVEGYYSERADDYEFFKNELENIGEWWFRQEYLCEFLERGQSLIPYEAIMGSIIDEDVNFEIATARPVIDTVEGEEIEI